MKIVVVGAFGNLGSNILKVALKSGHDISGLDQEIKQIDGIDLNKIKTKRIDVDRVESFKGQFDGADIVISTVGLVGRSSLHTPHQLDYIGNLNLLKEAINAGVKKFCYASHIDTENDKIPVLKAKHMFETKLKESGIEYLIIRPTTFFYQIKKDFNQMIQNKKIKLISFKDYKINCIDELDVAKFIVEHLDEKNKTYSIGGKEIYTYKEILKMFLKKTDSSIPIKRVPKFIYKLEGYKNRKIKNGITIENAFRTWRYTHNLISEIKYGESSFKQYIDCCKKY